MKIINPYRFAGADSLLTDLVAWWSLDETSGTRVNNHNPGTHDLSDTNTVGSTTGKQGNAADFVAVNSERLTLAHHSDFVLGDSDFTIAFWGMRQAGAEANSPFISKGAVSGSAGAEWHIYNASGVIRFRARQADNAASTTLSTAAISDDVWYLIIAQFTASTDELSIELNRGTPVTGTLTGGGYTGATGTLYFGGTTTVDLDGLIDEAAVWHRLLTVSEKDRLYNSGNGMAYPG